MARDRIPFLLGLGFILLVAVALRVWVAVDSFDWIVLREPVLDARVYHDHARGLLNGVWPDDEPFFFGPGYPVFLAAVYKLFGAEVWSARLVQMGLGVAMIAVIGLLGRRMWGEREGWLAAAFAALYAPFLAYEQFPLLDTVLTAGAVGLFGGALTLRDRPSRLHLPGVLGLGLLWGGLIAFRGTSLLFAAPLAILLLPGVRGRNILAGVCAAAAVIAPITLHNYRADSRAVIGTNIGLNLFIGNHVGASGMFVYPNGWEGAEDVSGRRTASRGAGRSLSADETNRFWLDQTITAVTDNPATTMAQLAKKAYLFVQREEIPQNESVQFFARNVLPARLAVVGWWFVLPLAAYGVWITRRRRDSHALVAAIAVPFVACVIFFVTGRYRLPAAPFIMLLAARGAIDLAGRRPVSIPRFAWVAAGWLVLLLLPRPFDMDRAMAREYEHVGLRYHRTKSVRAAESQYRRALEVDPTHVDAWNNLGALYAESERGAAAEEAYRRAVEHAGTNPVPLRNLAGLLGNQNRDAEAEILFRRALELAPADIETRINLGTALARQGKLDAAIAEYDRAIDSAPEHARARELRATADELRRAMTESPEAS